MDCYAWEPFIKQREAQPHGAQLISNLQQHPSTPTHSPAHIHTIHNSAKCLTTNHLASTPEPARAVHDTCKSAGVMRRNLQQSLIITQAHDAALLHLLLMSRTTTYSVLCPRVGAGDHPRVCAGVQGCSRWQGKTTNRRRRRGKQHLRGEQTTALGETTTQMVEGV